MNSSHLFKILFKFTTVLFQIYSPMQCLLHSLVLLKSFKVLLDFIEVDVQIPEGSPVPALDEEPTIIAVDPGLKQEATW